MGVCPTSHVKLITNAGRPVSVKLQMCSLFCSLFQAHSVFRYVVMGANTGRCSRTQNDIVVSKTELPVKKLNIRVLT